MDIYFELKRTVKQTLVYAFGTMATKLAGLILVPLYTKYLTVSEYGTLGLIELVLQITAVVGGLGLAPALIRWYSLAQSEQSKRSLLFTTMAASLGTGATVFLLSLVFSAPLAEFLFDPSSPEHLSRFAYYIRLVVLTAIFEFLLLVPLSLLRIQERAVLYSAVAVSRFTLLVVLNVALVAFFQLGIEGVLIGILLSTVLSFMVTVPYLRKNVQVGIVQTELKEMLKYGLPVMGASLAMILLSLADRYLLTWLSTLESVGLYTLGYRIAGIIHLLFVNAFALGFYPAIFKMTNRDERNVYLSKTFTYVTFLAFWSILTLSLFAPELLRLIVPNALYWEAENVVFLLSVGFGFYGMFYILSMGFYLEKRTAYVSALIFGAALFNFGLNILLIPQWGIIGAGVAKVLSYAALVALTATFVHRIYPVHHRWGGIVKVLLCTGGLYGISFLWKDTAVWTNLALDVIASACFPLLLYLLRFFDNEDLQRARRWISRVFTHSAQKSP